MISFKEAKIEMENKIFALKNTIKFIKANAYYEDFCDNCHDVMKVLLCGHGEKKRFCHSRCRSAYYGKRMKEQRKKSSL